MNNESTPEYVFSRDDGDSWHEEIEDALDEMREYDEDCTTLYMGRMVRHTHGSLLDVVSDIIENMQERAYDKAGDYACYYLYDIPNGKIDNLRHVIVEWFDTNVPQPAFCTVESPVEIKVQLDAEGCYVSHSVVYKEKSCTPQP